MDLEFELHGSSHVAKAMLPAWESYLDRSGAYASAGTASSSGIVAIVLDAETKNDPRPTEAELVPVRWFLDKESAVAEAVKAGIMESYGRLQEDYGYTGDEKMACMPDISSDDDLRSLIGLHAIHLHRVARDGIPYLGFEFGCTWDDEHGLGVMMHGTRVVEVGSADTAILTWIAKRDASRQDAAPPS